MSNSAASPHLTVLAFTDVVKFMEVKARIGDAAAAVVLSQHDRIVRSSIAGINGAEILQDTGDGFLLRFATASDGVIFALRLQFAIAREKWQSAPIQVRAGIHLGEVREVESLERGYNKVMGLTVDLTSRVMSLAYGGQILLTRGAFDIARQNIREHPPSDGAEVPRLRWMAHGPYLFTGTDEPLEVFEVGAEGIAPLREPADSDKARRAIMAGEELTLGWRPAAGLEIPGRPGWLLDRKLGEGGFGEVWLGSQRKLAQNRVFKFCFDSERLRSLKREMALFRLLRDTLGDRPDIARLHEVNLDHSPFFLESEYTAGGNLCDWAEARGGIGKLPMPVRLDFVARIADAIAAAHRAGVLHKDIKPSNILVYEAEDGSPRPRLSDFGIGMVEDLDTLRKHNITVAGFTLMTGNDSSRTGTRMYSPPELLTGQRFTIQGDVYSLGVLLYQVVVGNLDRPMAHGWEREVTDPLLRQDISDCAVGDPERRLKDAAELSFRLRSIEARRAAIKDAELAELRAAKMRHVKRLAVAAAVGILIVIGVVYAIYRIQQNSRMDLAKSQLEMKAIQKREQESARQSQLKAAETLLSSAEGMVANQKFAQASDVYKQAAQSAESAGLSPELAARVLVQGAECAMSVAATSAAAAVTAEHSPQKPVRDTAASLRQEAAGYRSVAADFAKRADPQLDSLLADPAYKPSLAVASIYDRLGRINVHLSADGDTPTHLAAAKREFEAAIRIAQPLGDPVLLASAQGKLADVYARTGASASDLDNAIRFTRQALDSAANTGKKELQYVHQWQLGKLLRRAGKIDESGAAYDAAGETAATMGYSGAWFNDPAHDPATGRRLARLYGEVADVALLRCDKAGHSQSQDRLADARVAIERRQIAELQDFFGETSPIALNLSLPRVGAIQPHTAVVYILPLQDRLELLIAIDNSLTHIPVPVSSTQLEESVAGFRASLSDVKSIDYKTSGGQLFKWLIQPLEPLLLQKKIDTLAFVPEGILRTVPLSPLYDSRDNTHLIEKYALSVVPGLSLTVSSADAMNQAPKVLCVGMSSPTGDVPAPRNIAAEMSMVEHAFVTPADRLLDDEFDFGNIFRHVKNSSYSIIHIASETHFDSESCHCAIRTSDEKQPLTLDKLEKLGRLHSLELLVLSCSQTAPGDERAAMGMSGLAYNSVVGAAVATLWNPNDPASATLLLEFYHQLIPEPGSPDMRRRSKAKAMQMAQKKLLKDEIEAHRHPFLWSPYLVIGESPMGSGN